MGRRPDFASPRSERRGHVKSPRASGPARGISLVALFVALSALLPACGGSGSGRLSASDYRAHLETVAKESNAAEHAVEAGLQAKSVPRLVKVLTRFKAAEKPIGDEVAALKPPTNAEGANANLAAGLRQTAAELQTSIIPRVEKMPSAQAANAARMPIAIVTKKAPR